MKRMQSRDLLSDIIFKSHLTQGYIREITHMFPDIKHDNAYMIVHCLVSDQIKFYTEFEHAIFTSLTWARLYHVNEFFDAINGSNEDRLFWVLKYGDELPIKFD